MLLIKSLPFTKQHILASHASKNAKSKKPRKMASEKNSK